MNCNTCIYFEEGRSRCRFNAPGVDEETHQALWPRVDPKTDYCRHHQKFGEVATKVAKKVASSAPPKETLIVPMAEIFAGTYDGLTPKQVVDDAPLMRGLFAVLGATQNNKVFTVSAKRKNAVREALEDHRLSDIAKAFEGWQYDPTGYWNGAARGANRKDPDPVKCIQHLERFLDYYNQRMNEEDASQDPDWVTA